MWAKFFRAMPAHDAKANKQAVNYDHILGAHFLQSQKDAPSSHASHTTRLTLEGSPGLADLAGVEDVVIDDGSGCRESPHHHMIYD